MKKRIMSIFLTLSLCIGLTVPASAAGTTVTLPKTAAEPGVTLTISNVLDTYKITLPMEKYVEGELVSYSKDATVYRVSDKDSYFSFKSSGFFEMYPGGDGSYVLQNGKFVMDVASEYFGQMSCLNSASGKTSMKLEEPNKNAIYGIFYGPSFNNDDVFYFTHGDLSAYDITPPEKPPVVPAAPAVPTAPKFTDVSAAAYYAEPVKWAVENNVTAGTSPTTFSPDDTCTNAQILTFMWRAAGSPEPAAANPFSNLTGNEYYAKAAVWAFENGMVSGSFFDGNKPCTRAMTMEYFWKQAGSPETAVSDKFTDVSANASYAQAVAWAVDTGVTAGVSENTFVPGQTCTRGHIVTFLYRALV